MILNFSGFLFFLLIIVIFLLKLLVKGMFFIKKSVRFDKIYIKLVVCAVKVLDSV